MKKVNICFWSIILVIIFMVVFTSCTSQKDNNTTKLPSKEPNGSTSETLEPEKENTEVQYLESNCKLIINGVDISNRCYVNMHFDERYVEMPLLSILDELGASISWESDKLLQFNYNNKEYILDINGPGDLRKKGDICSIIDPPPGYIGAIVADIDNEFIIHSDRIEYLLRDEFGLILEFDYNSALVRIVTPTQE